MKVAPYARVPTADQKTLKAQETMKRRTRAREWEVVLEGREVGHWAKTRPKPEELLQA